MKRIVSMLLLAVSISGVATTQATAQAPTVTKSIAMFCKTPAGTVKTRDTLTNSDTTYLRYRTIYAYDLQFEFTNTKISGYVRGTAKLEGTADSTNGPWYTVRGRQTYCPGCADSTISLTNASITGRWIVPKAEFNYYRIKVITDTTQVSTPSATLHYRY